MKLDEDLDKWRSVHKNDSDAHALLNVMFPKTGAGRVHFLRHCQYKHLLHLPGVSNSGRFKYLLGCGSAVVAYDFHQYREWWFPFLKNGTNYILLPWDEKQPSQRLYDQAVRLAEQDEVARRLAQEALRMVQEEMHPRVLDLYWYHVFDGERPGLAGGGWALDDVAGGVCCSSSQPTRWAFAHPVAEDVLLRCGSLCLCV